jgi:hypothetical protein
MLGAAMLLFAELVFIANNAIIQYLQMPTTLIATTLNPLVVYLEMNREFSSWPHPC